MTLRIPSSARVKIYDGGMGTTLRKEGLEVNNPLWGSDQLVTNPSAVRGVHQRFIEAGSDIIQTNTYQLSTKGLTEQFSKTNDEIQKVFGQGIDVAREATLNTDRHVEVALSLGSLGSTLGAAQEYSGVYPPPYGLDTLDYHEEGLLEALTSWHLDRLLIYSSTPAWSSINWLAFETVPLLREIRAIRRAMGQLQRHGVDKDFWITCPFPHGRFPGSVGHVGDVLRAACAPIDGEPPATGVGINCTHPKYLSRLANQFTLSYLTLVDQGLLEPGTVTMVLYPDGGITINPDTHELQSGDLAPKHWAVALAATVEQLESASGPDGQKIWKVVIVGGCCGTSYEHIRELRMAMSP